MPRGSRSAGRPCSSGKQVAARRGAPVIVSATWFAFQLPETYFVALGSSDRGYTFRRRLAGERAIDVHGRRSPRHNCIKNDHRKAISFIRHVSDRRRHALGFLGFVVLFPIATAIVLRATLYDAVRHFLFVIPPLAVLAAAGIESGLRPPVPRAVRAVIACTVDRSRGADRMGHGRAASVSERVFQPFAWLEDLRERQVGSRPIIGATAIVRRSSGSCRTFQERASGSPTARTRRKAATTSAVHRARVLSTCRWKPSLTSCWQRRVGTAIAGPMRVCSIRSSARVCALVYVLDLRRCMTVARAKW